MSIVPNRDREREYLLEKANTEIAHENKKIRGKTSRAAGKAFEKKVEKKLEEEGWMVIKFNKQVDLENNKLYTAKAQFNPFFGRIVGEGSGFPDFICIRQDTRVNWIVQLVECKTNGILDKMEKRKIEWIRNNLHLTIIVASKGEKRGEIKYEFQ